MGLPSSYAPIIVLLSVAIATIWLLGVRHAWLAYREWHDQRASADLVGALTVLVVALGLLISSLGFVGEGSVALAVAGLGVARGALLVGGITLVLAGWARR